MFCSQCGTGAEGKFCWNCGAPLQAGPPKDEVLPLPAVPVEDDCALELDWSDEVRYEILIRQPSVRKRIAHEAKQAKSHLSAEEFLKVCDKLVKLPIPMATLMKIAEPISERLGIQTGKTLSQWVSRPAGEVIVALLGSLARQGLKLRNVDQAHDGCCLHAAIPSSMWAFEGELILNVRRQPPGTFVEAATTIKGQLFDWGLSKSCLTAIVEDLKRIPA